MRIGVISDTHGSRELATQAIREMGQVNLLIHLGDYYEDGLTIGRELGIPIASVRGNCDSPSQGKAEDVILVENQKILLVHGHQYEVKKDLMRLYYRALELECGIALYGHTHIPINIFHHGILIFNPGSLGHPRGGARASYGILEIHGDEVKSEIIEI